MLKQLREQTGLEGFEVFRMLDKEHQKAAMQKLCHGLKTPVRVDFIKANTVANKAVSNKYGLTKMVKKGEMTPAMLMFHVPKMEIKKGGPRADLRPKGKVATLACGYQGGPDALVRMGALEAGIPEQDLPGIVKRWRNANKHIVAYWSDVEDAAIRAVQGEKVALRHGLRFFCEGGYLFIQLPSGRRLAYYKPQLQPEPRFDKEGVTYLGVNQETKGFARLKTYGGKLHV